MSLNSATRLVKKHDIARAIHATREDLRAGRLRMHTSCTKLKIRGGCCRRRLVKLWWERCRRGFRVQRCCWQFWLDDANVHPIPIYTLHQGFPFSEVWTSAPLAQFLIYPEVMCR